MYNVGEVGLLRLVDPVTLAALRSCCGILTVEYTRILKVRASKMSVARASVFACFTGAGGTITVALAAVSHPLVSGRVTCVTSLYRSHRRRSCRQLPGIAYQCDGGERLVTSCMRSGFIGLPRVRADSKETLYFRTLSRPGEQSHARRILNALTEVDMLLLLCRSS